MRTNYQTAYAHADMNNPSYFTYNIGALPSMTNQQLEVSNELHMSPLLPHTRPAPSPRSMATHIPQTPQLIVTAVLVADQPNSAPRCSTSAAINAQQLMK